MTERDKLEREIHQLTQIIAANVFALVSRSTPIADRAGLQRQIDIRSARWAGLLKKLSGASNLETDGTRRPTCVSRSMFTKPSSRRADCRQPDQPCSPALERSSRRTRRPNRNLAYTGHEPGRGPGRD